MAETSVTNQICQTCGADVRENSLFCYNCGGSVAPDVVMSLRDSPKNAALKNGDAPKQTTKLKLEEKPADAPIPKPAIQAEPELKSAASMRRKSKLVQPKRIEVIWEEHENAPNGWFILAAILLTLFAVAVFYLAIYLK
ncbi:MAG: zinc ribbon domain-containing protein [Pyrinomonadaceae bacterium]|nr:zinc ribbon domain-containing protein [Pyrinomonadaceae bacterium]